MIEVEQRLVIGEMGDSGKPVLAMECENSGPWNKVRWVETENGFILEHFAFGKWREVPAIRLKTQ